MSTPSTASTDPVAPTASVATGPAAGTVVDARPSKPAAGRSHRRPGHSALSARRRRRPRVAFVLAGGASRGALQVSMLRALFEPGIRPDLLVGTSAGALNAAYFASRSPSVQTVQALGRVWCSLHRQDVFPIHPPTLIGGLGKQRDHIVPDRPLRRLIGRHLELERLEDAAIPVRVVAFDLLSGQEVRLSHGPALEAVLAAATIPGVLPPVRWDEHLLVDGGVVNNTPISHAVELGAERVYVLPTCDPTDLGRPLARQGALDAGIQALTLLVGSRLPAGLERYAAAAELIVLPAAGAEQVQSTDFDHAHRLIASAHSAARAALTNPGAPLASAA